MYSNRTFTTLIRNKRLGSSTEFAEAGYKEFYHVWINNKKINFVLYSVDLKTLIIIIIFFIMVDEQFGTTVDTQCGGSFIFVYEKFWHYVS